ncbi:CLUMA_CG002457, isoform A [Clunio marinus]|uniref:CLUMA_CG002457, isoform A n=1 Tax=Clunio marinus TaxID=568069 RepID=A0A1J1HM39_9DIPT|nr:CLUMA_CG002457, isoform A [Clunio marinus]
MKLNTATGKQVFQNSQKLITVAQFSTRKSGFNKKKLDSSLWLMAQNCVKNAQKLRKFVCKIARLQKIHFIS